MKTIVNRQGVLLLATLIATMTLMSFALASKIEHNLYTKRKDHNAIINADKELLTVINVITPKEGQQGQIVASLQKGMTQTMRHQPGFISANIHKSLDSEHVIVYAQWKDAAALEAAVQLIQAGKAPNMLQVFSNSTPDYHPYDVISVNLPTEKK